MSFDRILGHKAALERLGALSHGERLAHAYVFAGPPGVGKRMVAEEFARGLDAELMPVERAEEKRDIAVEQVRELLRRLSFKSTGGRLRAVLVDDADRLNEEGQNALLKTLEEPPDRCLFILVTSSPALLLPTIVSRCHTVLFHPLSDREMAT